MNSVLPGPIWTPLIPSTMPPDQVAEFGKQVPLGRPGQPAELAPIYVLLASDEASYMSGGAYPVTGGNPDPLTLMKAVTWQGKRDVSVDDVPDPSIVEPQT